MHWMLPFLACSSIALTAGRSKFFPLQPSSQYSRMSAFSSSGVWLMNAFRRLRWFAMLSDSVFMECLASESSLQMRKYMAAVSFLVPASPILSEFFTLHTPFRFQCFHKFLKLVLPPEADRNAFVRMDFNA